jgi:hypothetical protein
VKETADVGQAPGGDRFTGELVDHLSEQVAVLIRDELKLAQVELTRRANRPESASGCWAAAGWWPRTAWVADRVHDHRDQRGGGGVTGGPDREEPPAEGRAPGA